MEKIKVGFIGLGLMGNPMAKNILQKGFPLTVYNRTKKKTTELEKMGATVVDSPQEVAELSDVIISMVTGPKDVKEVLFGNKGVVKVHKKDLVVIDMSTIGPAAAIEIGQKLQKEKIEFLDAPVTGSVPVATEGKLTIFVGGEKVVFEKIKPILQAMGTNLQYMGKTGSGQAIKLVNNLLVGSTMAALGEGFLLADLLKLPRKRVAEALENVPALSGFMRMKLPNMVNNKFPTAFSVANICKDLGLAAEETKKVNKSLPVLRLIKQLYKKAVDENLSQEDLSAVIKVLEK